MADEKTEKSKKSSNKFYFRALQNDLHIAIDGVRYVFKAGQVAGVDKNPGNFAVFKRDVASRFIELISEEEYHRLRKIAARKPVREAGAPVMTDEDFEDMISKLEGKQAEG